MTPAAKLSRLQALQAAGHRVLMLGDGVNDVPVLAAADVSVAMGSATDLAKTSADAVLLSNRLDALIHAFSLARRTRRVIIENLVWAALYRSEEHTSELQSLMRISYAVFCLQNKTNHKTTNNQSSLH